MSIDDFIVPGPPLFAPGSVVVISDEGTFWEYDVFIALHPEAVVVGFDEVAYEIPLEGVSMVFNADLTDIDFEEDAPVRAPGVFGAPLDDED